MNAFEQKGDQMIVEFKPINIDKNINVKHITTANGLSQSYIYDIIEDENGLIWIATQDGLNVYDGKHFKYYRNDIIRAREVLQHQSVLVTQRYLELTSRQTEDTRREVALQLFT